MGDNVENFILMAKPSRPFFSGTTLIAQSGIGIRPISGNINFQLQETTSINVLVGFSAGFTANGIYNQVMFQPVLIPDEASIALSDLLTVLE